MTPPIPHNEEERLAALYSYELLDSLREEEFDRLTELASIICGVPIALITLLDKDRQWFKSKVGFQNDETSRDVSFCRYAIMNDATMEVQDATLDERFVNNPLVVGDPFIRYYAGYPLTDPNGMALGSLCVIDHKPRTLTPDQLKALELLGKEVVSQIVARKKNRERVKLEKLFNYSIDLICIAGTDGYFKKVNPVFLETLGYTEEELLQKPFWELVHPDDKEKTLKETEKLSRGEKTLNFENRYKRKDGSYIILNWIANPDPESGELFAIARDITRKVQILQELKEAKQIAEHSVKVKDEFLSNMSHEIRTPLNAIIGFNDLLRHSNLDEEQMRYVEMADTASQNLMVIINDILDISKLESGILVLENRPIQLKKIAGDVVDLQSQKAKAKGIKILLNIDRDLPDSVYGDATRITQILLNLLANAVKFTSKGHVELKVMELQQNEDNSLVRFTVSDTGIGIPPDKQDSIFERFSQAESSTTRLFGGTGLGLHIVKMLVNRYNGKISLKSEPGKGSEFSVDIEFKKVKDSIEAGPLTRGSIRLDGMRVLIVDDNEHNQILASTYCKKNGAQTEVASNGKIAVEFLKEQPFDLVLMDLQMPEMDGFQATCIIRGELKLDIPIIACSAHSLVGEKENCLSKGMNEYISKPYTEQTLMSVLGKYPRKESKAAFVPDNFREILDSLEAEYGPEFVDAMTSVYKKRVPTDITELENYLANKDADNIKQKAHLLAGSLASMNFMKGYHLAKNAETAAREWDHQTKEETLLLIEYLKLSLPHLN